MSDYILNINSTDEEESIIIEDENNNKVVWDESNIKFYTSNFPNNPIYYNKRVAFGVAEHNEYVDLTNFGGEWTREPSVHLSMNSFPVYLNNYDYNGQDINLKATNITSQGFDVIAQLNSLSSTRNNDYDPNIYLNIDINESDYTNSTYKNQDAPPTNNNCNRIIVNGRAKYEREYNTGAVKAEVYVNLFKYNNSNDSWDLYEEIYRIEDIDAPFDESFSADTGNIPEGKYTPVLNIKVSPVNSPGPCDVSGWLYDSTEYYEEGGEIGTGQVNWVAIEKTD